MFKLALQSFDQDDTFYQCNTGRNALTILTNGFLHINQTLRKTVFKDAEECFCAPFEMGKPTPKDIHWFPKVSLNDMESTIPIKQEFVYVHCTNKKGKDTYR